MSLLRAFTLLCLILMAISGCVGINPENLKSAESNKNLYFDKDFSYIKIFSFGGTTQEYTILKGVYKAMYDDGNGIYYQGNNRCFSINIIAADHENGKKLINKPVYHRCGIYVPNDKTDEAKIYYYIEGNGPTPDIEVPTEADVITTKRNTLNESVKTGNIIGDAAGYAIVGELDRISRKNINFFWHQPKAENLANAFKIR